MKNIFKSMALVAGVAALSMTAAMAQQSDALIDALVKKGVLSDQEAEEIRVDLTKDYNQTSAGKIQLSSFISKLTFFGDARLRYEYLNARANTGGGNGTISNGDRDRFRYRLRLGATYTYDAHWSATVRLETATANNSSNVDFGRYFDKYGDGMNVGLVYLEYQNQWSLFDSTSTVANGKSYSTVTDPGFTLTTDWRLGKAPKQIMLSEAFWDADTNPEGVAQEFGFSNLGVDGLSLYARGAEYFPGLNNTSNGENGVPDSDEIGALLIGQLEVKYAWDSNSNVRVAPTFLTETKSSFGNATVLNDQEVSGTSSTGIAPSQALTGANPYPLMGRLAVLMVPAEVNWKMFGQPNQVWGTYGANLEGNDRLHSMGFAANQHGQNTFWNAGYQIGQSKKKGDWMASAEYRWIEAAAYTTNLQESDWANNDLNQQGFVLRGGYNITDFLFGQVSYYHSNPIETGAGNNGNGVVVPASGAAGAFGGQIDRVQVDLSWKF